jgi:hypothetical protein
MPKYLGYIFAMTFLVGCGVKEAPFRPSDQLIPSYIDKNSGLPQLSEEELRKIENLKKEKTPQKSNEK